MSPDEINADVRTPVWLCWRCKTDIGLHWWRGLSIACCDKPDCEAAVRRFFDDEMRKQRDQEEMDREWWG